MKTIRIDEFLLQELQRGDAGEIFRAIDSQREYLGRWLPFVACTLCEKDSAAFVESTLAAEPYQYVFTMRDKEGFAGLIGFKPCGDSRTREIGYWLREERQGRGMVTRSVEALCRFAAAELDIERTVIRCAAGNGPSNRIPQRLGFLFEGVMPHGELMSDGRWVDLNIWTKRI